MINKNRQQLNLINIASDAAIVFLSYLLAMWVRFRLMNGVVSVNPFQGKLLIGVAVLAIVMAIAYQALHSSYGAMVLVTAFGTLALMALFFVYRMTEFSRWSLALFFVLGSVLVVSKHYLGHKLVENSATLGYGKRTIAVAGNGKTARQYHADVKKQFPDYTVLDYSENPDVDEIVIALEPDEADKVPEILAFADKEGIYVSLIPFYSDYIPVHPEIDTVGRSKLINLRATPLDNIGNAMIKRTGDVILSALAIIILSPLMLITMLGVRLSSPGPVFFKQERVGKDKKNFNMLKFRSMRVNAEENTAWSTDVDPRRTKFGSFIRKYSIDELPQLFNVFKGDMSLVGPRPEIPHYVNQFKESIPMYLVRQQVRPGMTGWAQVNGLRGDTSIEDRVNYDIWYIENWSATLDIEILFKTVFGGKFKNEEK